MRLTISKDRCTFNVLLIDADQDAKKKPPEGGFKFRYGNF